MSDVVCTVPKRLWQEWIDEGMHPGDDWDGETEYYFYIGRNKPNILPHERVYIIAYDKLRGYAPLIRIEETVYGLALVRRGDAVACTISEPIKGFRGYQYRWWPRDDEMPFPDWKDV